MKIFPFEVLKELNDSLLYIYLYGCHIHTIWISPLEKIVCPKLQGMFLFDNPFRCDCHLRPFIHYLAYFEIDVDVQLQNFTDKYRRGF